MKAALYETCPVYETERFTLRLVEEGDAEDLLACYSDPEAARFFNSDNCDYGFDCKTLADMKDCIRRWLSEYEAGRFVRFAIVDKRKASSVGTLEIFARGESAGGAETVGVLRLDLSPVYENRQGIDPILKAAVAHFYSALGIGHLITKAIPEAKERVGALLANGFAPLPESPAIPYGDYYTRPKSEE